MAPTGWILGKRWRAAAAAVALVALMAPLARAADENDDIDAQGDLAGFAGSATAVVIRVYPSFPGFTVSDPPAEGDAPHTTVNLRSGPAGFARSSMLWPGDLLGHLGVLLKQANPAAPDIPNYPIVAEASSPGGHDHLELAPGVGVMDARADGLVAEATGSLVQPGVAAAVTTRATSSSSRAQVLEGQIVVTTDAVIEGLDILEGTVTADEIRTLVVATSDGHKGVGEGGTTVAGLKVAGVPVAIDDNGVHAAGQDGPPPPALDQQVQSVLAATGIQLQLLNPVQTVQGAGVNRAAAGLLVRIPVPELLPQVSGASLTIAFAGANAGANASLGGLDTDVLGETVEPSSTVDDVVIPEGPTIDSDLLPDDGGLPDLTSTPAGGLPAAPAAVTALPSVALEAAAAAYRYGGIPWQALLAVVVIALFAASRVRRWLGPFV